MSRGRRLGPEERRLWREVTRSVAPLRPQPAEESVAAEAVVLADPILAEPVPPASPRPAQRPVARPPQVSPQPPLAPLGQPLRRKLARGHAPIDGRLDLHGLTQSEAHLALVRFLRRAQADGLRTVLVITGKGMRDADGRTERGVLRRQVPLWLGQAEFRQLVIGFEAAHGHHGGDGALYLRIRRAR